ncbi:NUDIX domain-containing protein [Candidatus Saccharibacteria bacterium]|nr:NUDIX domain-containing protein [Candidatus Saccharibacteria bacterium]
MGHIHEKIDFTVAPVIIHPDKDKVLLVHHPRYKKWLCIGGHIELDENPDQALMREIEEECGLEVKVLSDKPDVKCETSEILWRPRFVDIHDANSPHRHIGMVYFCLAKTENFILSDEHEEMRWFTLIELEALGDKAPKHVLYYCRVALDEVKND